MSTRKKNIIPAYQTIFRAFPGTIRYLNGQLVKIRNILNPNGERLDPLSARVKMGLVDRIIPEIERIQTHQQERNRRVSQRQNNEENPSNSEEDFLDSFFDDEFNDEFENDVLQVASINLQPRDISLIEIDPDTSLRTNVYPRSVHCVNCNHFFLLDPQSIPTSLVCPCCNQDELVVEPIVFVCGRCANYRELLPPGEVLNDTFRQKLRHDEYLGGPVTCPDCNVGHIHLNKHESNSVARWQWECNNCSTYQEVLQEMCLSCLLPRTENAPADRILMNAIPAAASNALQPLIDVQMFVRDQPISLAALRTQEHQIRNSWEDAFIHSNNIPNPSIQDDEILLLEESCLSSAYLVNEVQVFTTNFGYKAGAITNHPQTPVASDQRLAKFYRDPEGFAQYLAFFISTKGNALVLEFDPDLIIDRLSSVSPRLSGNSYERIIQSELLSLDNRSLNDLNHLRENELFVYRSMHALEHALLNCSMLQIGNEALGTHFFPTLATILIYEREQIGRGGVIQLVNKGEGIPRLFAAAKDQMLGCAQGCYNGCPSCVYLSDTHCNQPIADMPINWLPPNSLLSRVGAGKILDPNA